MMRRIFCGILFIVALSSCSGIGDNATSLATVTLMVTPNGLGDNGYYDAAAEGIFAFAEETGTRLRLLLPGDGTEAEQLYRQWLTENAAKDSVVLILGSSSYESMARKYRAELSGNGSRVLLFESNAAIDGISSVMVSHYGVSYLAGDMSQGFDALILAASEGIPSLKESIDGYRDARKAYAGEFEGRPCRTTLHYFANGEEGFAMPDSAYRYIARRAKSSFLYNEMIFPLLGGSQAGILRYLNDDEFSAALMAGMDVDQTGQSSRIPFSVVIRIGDVLNQYLTDWSAGREWPACQRLGMKDGAADIVITPRFKDHLVVWDNRYADPDTFQNLYDRYKEEAIAKEEDYVNAKDKN